MDFHKRNLKMVIAYEGTGYAGFQRQKPGIPTIQETLENAILKITGEEVAIIGAGRTDAGVHASGQVVNFFSDTQLNPDVLKKALNSVLPEDILIKDVIDSPIDFHARFSAKSKTYSYKIYHNQQRPIFERKWVYHYRYALDFELMQQAASLLIGLHDFKCFQAAGSAVKTTIRTINFCTLGKVENEIIIRINADGFLYHMVRNIVGTLLLVGSGKITISDFEDILRSGDRKKAGPTAPARGLCLEEVFYE